MNDITLSKRAATFGKVAAILVAALGLYAIGVSLLGLWRTIYAYDSLEGLIFTFMFTGGVIVLGGWCLLLGYRAWSNMSSHIVRRLSLVAAVLFCVVLVFVAETLGFDVFGEGTLRGNIAALLLLIMGGSSYLVCSKLLITWLTLSEVLDRSRREKAVKSFFSLLALFLWVALSSVIFDLAPKEKGYTHDTENLLSFWLPILGSFVLIYLVYRVGIYIALRNSRAEEH